MNVRITPTAIPDVLIIEPRIFSDPRGCFLETYHLERYSESGIPGTFVQDNVSFSVRNVLRGFHYQLRRPQAKLVMVLRGKIFDVAVDIRVGSPTFGRWASTVLSTENAHQIFIPEGFAHGFCVLSHTATVLYKCTDFYTPSEERGVRWDDPRLSVPWPVRAPILSPKDAGYPTLDTMPLEDLPVYGRRS